MRGASLEMIQEARRGEELLVRAELLVACMGDAAAGPSDYRRMRATALATGCDASELAPLTPYSDITL